MSLNKLIQIFEDSLDDIPKGSLTEMTEYKKLKTWDSLGVLTVVDGIEMELGVLVLKQEFDAATTLAELYGLIEIKGGVSGK
jgi:acyl carrier protein